MGWFWFTGLVPSGWDDVRHGCASVPWVACVFGLEGSGMALGSIPCLAYVNEADGAGMALRAFRLISFYFLNL